MLKKWIRNKLFEQHQLHKHPYLEKFGDVLLREDLWHINRHSIARATGIGIFCAFTLIPFQMLLSGFLAILLRGNILLAVALVWISNPFTIGPILYICYKIGQWVLGNDTNGQIFEWNELFVDFNLVFGPLLIGSLITAIVLGVVSYFTVNLIWRLHIIRYVRQRRR